jgi:hypothetical protein
MIGDDGNGCGLTKAGNGTLALKGTTIDHGVVKQTNNAIPAGQSQITFIASHQVP